MSGAPTFDTEKKQKLGEFITPPRPTDRRSKSTYIYIYGIGPYLGAKLWVCNTDIGPKRIGRIHVCPHLQNNCNSGWKMALTYLA